MRATDPRLVELLDAALGGDVAGLERHLVTNSRLPGPRANLELIDDFARAAADVAIRPGAAGEVVDRLEAMLDAWAGRSASDAPGDRPEVLLPCAAVAAYGAIGAARPAWWHDEIMKLHRSASDERWRVREIVAQAVQRLLAADWDRTIEAMSSWATDTDPLVVRAAGAAVAEPPLLDSDARARAAADVVARAVASFAALPPEQRRTDGGRALRQGLGYIVSVTVAATGDFEPLERLAASDDRDLRWIAKQNAGKARLGRWPDALAHLHDLLDD